MLQMTFGDMQRDPRNETLVEPDKVLTKSISIPHKMIETKFGTKWCGIEGDAQESKIERGRGQTNYSEWENFLHTANELNPAK